MSTVQCLRTFVNERLTAAAEEILGVFEKTIEVYEEEIGRQRRLLDIVWKPEIKLHRTDPPQPSVIKEEVLLDQQHCNQQKNLSLGQEDPEPKEEQEELYPYQTRSVAKKEPLANISSESDREGSAVSEPDSDHQLLSHNCHVAESQGYKTSSCGNVGSTRSTEPKPNKKPHKCNSCSKGFPTLSHLNIHARTHTGEKPFRCDTCGKTFSQKSTLKNHMRTHTGEKPFRCRVCRKGFTCQSNCEQHVKIHSGEKPHACNTCGKRFGRGADLKRHMRVHTGEKPYSCVYCGKNFADSSYLTKHLRVHTGEKPYTCLLCGKRFAVSSSLKVHTQIHTRKKLQKCSVCGEEFTSSSNLKKHKTVHTRVKQSTSV
uniref:uncharacterized protein n=1 Tax=Centroberyx gerrardi TaxID=166262 RepID=UPI003AAB4ED0